MTEEIPSEARLGVESSLEVLVSKTEIDSGSNVGEEFKVIIPVSYKPRL